LAPFYQQQIKPNVSDAKTQRVTWAFRKTNTKKPVFWKIPKKGEIRDKEEINS
jgi:hypothetical protein